LDNIFREFYEVADIKAHHSGVTEFKSSGLGLGLPITKTIIEHYGGKMWVKSVKGEGSTFFISLPFAKKNEKLSGMVINTDEGWILKLGGLRGATFYYDTRKECLESCKQYGYEFYIED